MRGVFNQRGDGELFQQRRAEIERVAHLNQRRDSARTGPYPAEPQPTPEAFTRRAERNDRILRVKGSERRRRGVFIPEIHHRFVYDKRGAAGRRYDSDALAGGGVHAVAGGVVVIGNDIGEARRGLGERRRQPVRVPALACQ